MDVMYLGSVINMGEGEHKRGRGDYGGRQGQGEGELRVEERGRFETVGKARPHI